MRIYTRSRSHIFHVLSPPLAYIPSMPLLPLLDTFYRHETTHRAIALATYEPSLVVRHDQVNLFRNI